MEALVTPTLWRGKRVFLTGHTGFKGGWLSLWLDSLGAKVHGFALPPASAPNFFREARVADCVHHELGDIRDPSQLGHSLSEAQPDVVFHLAAQALVRHSYADPVETFTTNVLGTVHVLEAVRACPSVKAVVIVTSDKCYENQEQESGYRETDPMGGADPYSASKGCAELVAASYRRSFFGRSEINHHGALVATARAGNVIGGGDWSEDRIIPDLVRAIRANRPIELRNPEATRPWQHVLEPLAGYIQLAEQLLAGKPAAAGPWNFGPFDQDAIQVGDLTRRFLQAWPSSIRVESPSIQHPHEAHFLRLDWTKAREQMNWKPRWRLDRALEMTASWYRRHAAGEDARALTLEQIDEYVAGR